MVADGDLNFRVRGIPNAYENKSGVRKLIMEVLSIQPGTSVSVRSLAASPVDANTRVATVVFHRLPAPLSERDKDEWSFSLPVREDVDEDDIDWPLPIIFDTHFIGFTPLDHAIQSESHVESALEDSSGLGGHAFGSFKDRDGPFMWLRDALPLDFLGSRILVYGYNTRLHQSHSFQNLIDLSRALLGDLQGLRGRDHDHPTVFIGHSLGGLVIKEAVVNDQNVLTLERVLGFVFFGVPHLGMATRSLVPLVNNQPNRCLVESLNKNSAFLQHLDNDFNKMISGKGPKVVSFYETEESPTAAQNHNGEWRLSGPTEILVDVSSATCGAQHSYPIDRNHSEMVKFRNHYDEFYIRLRSVLQPLLVRRDVMSAFICTEASPASMKTPDAQYQCLRSLSFQEQESRHINILCAKDTCGWILEDPQYRAWMRSSSGLFWVKGNPGAGKSVLMKFACQTMSMQQRKEDGLVVSFFVYGQGNTLQKTPFGMFRALLNSLLLRFPEPLSQLTERFEDRERRYGSYEQGRWKWEENELRDFLSDLIIQRTGALSVTIFVDALDACGESQAKTLLAYFKTVAQTAKLENGQVRVCMSSRHYPILRRNSIPTISVEERNHRDIRLYVQQSLREIESESERHSIESEILLKAQGGFQWVVLVTTRVTEGSTRGIRADQLHEYLKSIPEDLDELYARLVHTATGVEEREMVKLFLWILCATRPLSAHELREALASDKDMEHATTFGLRRHRSWISNIAQFEVYIQHISRGLVEFQTRDVWEKYDVDGGYEEEWDREAQFVHQSVADFLLKSFPQCSKLAPYSSWTATGLGNFEISRSCLKYLKLQDVFQGAQLPRVAYCTRFPLLQYAVSSVFDHIWQLDEEGIPQTDLLNLFGWDEDAKSFTKIASVWKVLDPDGGHAPAGWPFTGSTALHALAAFGVKSAFDSYLNESVLVDSVDADGNTPFLLAIRHKELDMALALLDRSIAWEQRLELADCPLAVQAEIQRRASYQVNFKVENYEGETALTIALDQDADKVVLKLLDMKDHFDISGLDVELVTCAVRGRNLDLLKKLIGMNISLDGVIYFAVHELSWAEDDDFLDATIYNCLKAGANIFKSAAFGLTAERQSSTESDPSTSDEIPMEVEDAASEDPTGSEYATDIGDIEEITDTGDISSAHGNHSSRSEDLEGEYDDALSLAILKGCANTVRCLLSHGVSASVRTQDGGSPLYLAVTQGCEEIARILLVEAGVDVNFRDEEESTPLSIAIRKTQKGLVRLLLQHGAKPDAKTATIFPLFSEMSIDATEDILKLLLAYGIEFDSRLHANFSQKLLSLAAESGNAEVVRILLQDGLSTVDLTDEYGRTPLYWAVKKGDEDTVRLLLDIGKANPNVRDNTNYTPLSWATIKGHQAIVKLLLDIGKVDPDVKDNDYTPLMWATINGDQAIVDLLLETGKVDPDVRCGEILETPLLRAAQEGEEEIVRLLLHTGKADPDAKDMEGRSPLLYAAALGHTTVAQILLDTGQVKADTTDVYGRSPLSFAAQEGHESMVRLLCKREGVDLNSQGKCGHSPIFIAALLGCTAVARVLLETGQVEADVMDVYGRTPLSYATEEGHESIVRLLCERERVDLNLRDKAGRSPLSYAAEHCNAARLVEVWQNTRKIDIPSTDLWSCPPFWYLTHNAASAVVDRTWEDPFGHPHRVGLALDFYGRDSPVSTINVAVFTARGYTVIFTFSCGKFGSDGTFVPGMSEQADSHGVAAWMRRQKWFPGRFDTFGSSYLVYTQWGLLRDPPPYLACSTVLRAPNDHAVFNWMGEAYRLNRLRWSNATPSPREKPPRAGRRP